MVETVERDESLVKTLLAEQGRMENKRKLYEPIFEDIDRFVDPFGSGGFSRRDNVDRGIEDLYDVTAVNQLDRGTAVITSVTTPRNSRWHGVSFQDKDLTKIQSVKLWCEHATDQMFAARYNPKAGFETQMAEDARQELKYGTSPLRVDDNKGQHLFYKSLHLSEIYIKENFFGRVDRTNRKFELSLCQAADEYGLGNLSDKLQGYYETPAKRDDKHEFLHVLRPNLELEDGRLGWRGKPIESIHLEMDTKHMIRRSGFYTMPILTSRHITGPRDEYGRSPAMKILAVEKGLNAMGRTILDAGNRAVDPPLLFHDDADISALITKPGGLNPGGIDEFGRELVKPLYTGAQLPFGMEMQAAERAIVEQAFFEEYFRLLSNPSDRMTATQVIEQLQKEGVLISPIAGRRETEKISPMGERELDILMRVGFIRPMPPEVIEAGAKPRVYMSNPLSRMARAEEVSGFTRLVEIGIQAASTGLPNAQRALKIINFENGMRDTAEVLGVRPSHLYTPEELATQDAAEAEQRDVAQAAAVAPQVAGAALDLARANEISANLAGGGGL